MEEPGRLQSMELQRVRHDYKTFTFKGVAPIEDYVLVPGNNVSCSASRKQGYILTGSLLEQFSNSLVRVSVLPGE